MIRIEPAGAEALLLTLAEEPEVDLSVRLAELARRLREGLGEGVRDLVPGWTTLMLHYDPTASPRRYWKNAWVRCWRSGTPGVPPRMPGACTKFPSGTPARTSRR